MLVGSWKIETFLTFVILKSLTVMNKDNKLPFCIKFSDHPDGKVPYEQKF